MDGPSSSSRKRPLEAMAGATIGDAIDTRSTCNDDMDDTKNISFTSSCNVSAAGGDMMYGNCSDDDCVVHQFKRSGCSDTEEDEDMAEIVDLQNALEYLVSGRDIEHTYNNGDNQKQHTARSHTTTTTGTNDGIIGASNEQLYMIPNLVNRIIMEHYSSANKKHNNTDVPNYMSRKQKDKMTKLLIAVIVEFAEPYFVRKAQYRKQERDRLLLLKQQQKKQMQTNENKITSSGTVAQDDKTSSSFEFDERAISWATSCIKQLLQAPSPKMPPNANNTNNDMMNDSLDDGHLIPELDALLSASGEHDGIEMEECIQSALLQGLQCQRLLQSMGISFVGGTK